jgi:hypothetical protein
LNSNAYDAIHTKQKGMNERTKPKTKTKKQHTSRVAAKLFLPYTRLDGRAAQSRTVVAVAAQFFFNTRLAYLAACHLVAV